MANYTIARIQNNEDFFNDFNKFLDLSDLALKDKFNGFNWQIIDQYNGSLKPWLQAAKLYYVDNDEADNIINLLNSYQDLNMNPYALFLLCLAYIKKNEITEATKIFIKCVESCKKFLLRNYVDELGEKMIHQQILHKVRMIYREEKLEKRRQEMPEPENSDDEIESSDDEEYNFSSTDAIQNEIIENILRNPNKPEEAEKKDITKSEIADYVLIAAAEELLEILCANDKYDAFIKEYTEWFHREYLPAEKKHKDFLDEQATKIRNEDRERELKNITPPSLDDIIGGTETSYTKDEMDFSME